MPCRTRSSAALVTSTSCRAGDGALVGAYEVVGQVILPRHWVQRQRPTGGVGGEWHAGLHHLAGAQTFSTARDACTQRHGLAVADHGAHGQRHGHRIAAHDLDHRRLVVLDQGGWLAVHRHGDVQPKRLQAGQAQQRIGLLHALAGLDVDAHHHPCGAGAHHDAVLHGSTGGDALDRANVDAGQAQRCLGLALPRLQAWRGGALPWGGRLLKTLDPARCRSGGQTTAGAGPGDHSAGINHAANAARGSSDAGSAVDLAALLRAEIECVMPVASWASMWAGTPSWSAPSTSPG